MSRTVVLSCLFVFTVFSVFPSLSYGKRRERLSLLDSNLSTKKIEAESPRCDIDITLNARPGRSFSRPPFVEKSFFIDYELSIRASAGGDGEVVKSFTGKVEVESRALARRCRVKVWRNLERGRKPIKSLLRCFNKRVKSWRKGIDIPISLFWTGCSENEEVLAESGLYNLEFEASLSRQLKIGRGRRGRREPKIIVKEIDRIDEELGEIALGLFANIDEPAEGAILSSQSTTVTGSLNSSSCSVLVKGEEASRQGRAFYLAVSFDSDGNKEVLVEASNGVDSLQLSREVIVDSTAPQIEVLEPSENLICSRDPVNARCRVNDTTEVEVFINGYQATEDSPSVYSYPINLVEGQESTVEFRAIDEAQNVSSTTIEGIILDTTAPTGQLTGPDRFVNDGDVVVSGECYDEVGLEKVEIGSLEAQITGNTFSATLSLTEGEHVISDVKLIDKAGNETSLEDRLCTVDLTPAALLSISPAEGSFITEMGSLELSGELDEENPKRLTLAGIEAELDGENFTAQIDVQSSGSLEVPLVMEDLAGNISQRILHYRADSIGPEISSFPGNGHTLVDDTPEIGIDYSDAVAGVDESTVVIRLDNEDRTQDFSIDDVRAHYQVPSDQALAPGPHSIGVEVSDLAGNESQYFAIFSIEDYEDDGSPPVISGLEQLRIPRFSPFENPYDKSSNRYLKLPIVLSKPASISLTVKNPKGREVATRSFPYLPSGDNLLSWNGKSDRERFLKPGSYLIKLRASDNHGRQSLVRSLYTRIFF